MKRTITLALVALCTAMLTACSTKDRLDTRTFVVTHLDQGSAMDVVGPYVFTEREGAPGSVRISQNAISVRETPDNLRKIERMLSEMDKPRSTVRLHYRFVRATASTRPDTNLRDILPVLKGILRFPGYELIGETVTLVAEGGTASQTVPVFSRYGAQNQLAFGNYALRTTVEKIGASGDTGVVMLDVALADHFQRMEQKYYTLATRVGVRIGEVAALGSAQSETMWRANDESKTVPEAGTIILVVRAEIVKQ